MVQKINELPLTQIDGSPAHLSDFAGSVLLIVNVASKCGLTPQYTALQAIYDKYKSQGFEILAFPSNEFAAQEPGTDAEISDFCSLNYGVTFPLFSKICVNGELRHPLYQWLIAEQPQATPKVDGTLRSRLADRQLLSANETDIMWNFEKFLLGRNGQVIGRYAPDITPDSPELIAAIELALQ
ncbi:MAG: glutathione peroxidase [Tolumonas sp.]|nr:glutathione peroxidase [Tolumonas sp.]